MKIYAVLVAILLIHFKMGDCAYFVSGSGYGNILVNANQQNNGQPPNLPGYPVYYQLQNPSGNVGYQVSGNIQGKITVHGEDAGTIIDGHKKEDGAEEEKEIVKPKPEPTVLEWSSFCYAKPNTEELVGSKSVFVTYPGLSEEVAKPEAKVTLKIFNDNEEVMKFNVPEDEKRLEKVYRFALQGATAGKYSSQLCVNELCSEKSAPSTEMDVGTNCDGERHMLNCQRVLADKTEKSIAAYLVPVDSLATDATVDELKGMNGSVAEKYNLEKNGQIFVSEDGEVLGYTVVQYPIKNFRELLRADDLCKRKYTFVVLTYIVNKITGQVVKIGRLTPYMPKRVYEKYLGLNINNKIKGEYEIKQADLNLIPLTPIELLMDLTDFVNQKEVSSADRKGDYKIWQIPCVVRKDGSRPGITRCAEPFIHEWNYDFKKVQVPEVPENAEVPKNPEVPDVTEAPAVTEVPEAKEEQEVDDALDNQKKKNGDEEGEKGGLDKSKDSSNDVPVVQNVDNKNPVPTGGIPPGGLQPSSNHE